MKNWLKPFTAEDLAEQQRNAPFVRWHHFQRLLRVLEVAHEVTQAARWSRYRSEVAREAELLPQTQEHIAELWRLREVELAKVRKPHAVEKPGRVIVPIPARKAAGA